MSTSALSSDLDQLIANPEQTAYVVRPRGGPAYASAVKPLEPRRELGWVV